MSERLLADIEAKIDELVLRHRLLTAEYDTLREREQQWLAEKARLVEKNETAQARIEAMIERLKQLEAQPK